MTPPDSPARVPRVDAAGRVRMVPTPAGWRGVRVSTQAEADAKVPLLLGEPAELWLAWCEPTEAIDLRQWLPNPFSNGTLAGYWYEKDPATPRVRWLIVSGQCGPTARPMHPEWVRSLRDQAKAAGVAFLFVGWGEWCGGDDFWSGTNDDAGPAGLYANLQNGTVIHESKVKPEHWKNWCDDDESHGVNDPTSVRVGKRAAGRLLDGVTHDATPQPTKGGTR